MCVMGVYVMGWRCVVLGGGRVRYWGVVGGVCMCVWGVRGAIVGGCVSQCVYICRLTSSKGNQEREKKPGARQYERKKARSTGPGTQKGEI